MNPPRVLFVVAEPVHGGSVENARVLAAGGREAGYEAAVMLLRPGPMVPRFRESGVPVMCVDVGRLRSARQALGWMVRLARIAQRFDAVVATDAKGHLYAWVAGLWRGTTSMWRQPGHPNPRSPIDLVASLLPANAVVVPSEHTATLQRRMPGTPPVRVVVPGVAQERLSMLDRGQARARLGVGDETMLVGIVGRLQRWKGQELFLRAAALVARHHPNTRFLVVGGAELPWDESDYVDELHRLASELGLADVVDFHGQVDEALEYTVALDIAVNASEAEPFGLVIIEAMALGVPVVAYRGGGPAEIIDDSVTGRLVPRLTAVDFADAIAGLLSDPAERGRLSVAARSVAKRKYRDRDMCARFARVVREVTV